MVSAIEFGDGGSLDYMGRPTAMVGVLACSKSGDAVDLSTRREG